jgi:hypothetical protein
MIVPYASAFRSAPWVGPVDTETLEGGVNLTTRLGDIDLLGELVGGGRYEDLIPHSIEITLFGLPCRCLDLPTLIRVKRAAGRRKDLDAISELTIDAGVCP